MYHKILPNEEIIKSYYETKSARKTAAIFGIDHSTVDDILNSNNIPRFSQREVLGKKILVKKDDFEIIFNSVKDCAEWFVENRICQSWNPESVRGRLK